MGEAKSDAPAQQEPVVAQQPDAEEEAVEEQMFTLFVAPPATTAGKDAPLVRLDSVSAGDTVLSLRQLIAEYPALAGYTCYHLEVHSAAHKKWVVLNDFVELGEYEDVVDRATLKMVLEKYDARKVRAHVRRFRDVLSNPPIPQLVGDEDEHDGGATPRTPAATPSGSKSSKSKRNKNKQQQVAVAANGTSDAAAATAETTSKSEISETQLQQLRDIHAKLETVTVPVLPELKEFYTLPGASSNTTSNDKTASNSNTPGGKKGKKKSGDKNKQTKQQDQDANASNPLDATLPTCIKSIVFSGYNPPPGPRKLAGDLLYLEVKIADGAVFHVTAHVNGFYVNRSTTSHFDPAPHSNSQQAHLLVDVLSNASEAFKNGYAALLAKAAALAKQGPASIEWMVAAGNNVGGKLPWNTPLSQNAPKHTYDLNRAEDELTASFGMDERGVLRDWNEEYQCCRELPHATVKEQIVRARVMYKIVNEFVEAATQGAVAIVEGHIPPINPMDDASAHVYVFNNIFFSLSIDGKVTPKDAAGGLGDGEEAAYSSANRDLQGVKAFNEADIPGLHTLATTIVDYLGVRVIAQSVIPGILQGEAASKLVYGSVDGGKTIASNDKMHALMIQAGEKLHIAERSIQPLGKDESEEAATEEDAETANTNVGGEAGTEVVKLCGPVEAKGILGSDGRMYVLDLVRITPKDATYYASNKEQKSEEGIVEDKEGLRFHREDEGYVALLRPELVQLYALWKQNQARKEAREVLKAAKKSEDATTEGAKPEGESAEKEDEEIDVPLEDIPLVRLNPNVFMKYNACVDETEAKTDEEAANDAAAYLQNVVIPAFVSDVRRGAISPADGFALTELMHSCGINMRYLGRIASLAKKLESIGGISKYTLELLEVEMLARATKHLLADVLNADEATRAAPGDVLVRILNGIFGAAALKSDEDFSSSKTKSGSNSKKSGKGGKQATPQPQAPVKKRKSSVSIAIPESEEPVTAVPVAEALDAKTVWQRLEKEIQNRFDYTLTLWNREEEVDSTEVPLGRVHKTVLLRRLCQRNGLRVIDDITGVVPVVKHSLPAHPLAHAKQLLERGRLHLSGGSLATAYELLQETSAFLFQVCGAAHEDAALCSTSLATVLYHAGDLAGAIAQQQRALALYTQLCGIDYHDTAFAHANLALFLHANGQTDVAVAHLRRAIYLLELCAGPHFPEISSLYFKMGMMCQDVGQITLALLCHRESLKRGELDRIQAANTLHQMALACGLAGGFREALAYEKKVYSLFKEAFGEDDPRVVEATKFMAKFTERAVEGAKGRVEVDAAAQADAIAHELLAELTIKDEGATTSKKKSKKSKASKKH
ncbi:Eukaryotic translation initiation factor 3 subunit, partial [Globisporangium splendens]